MKRSARVTALTLALVPVLPAQADQEAGPAGPPTFEVASVRPSTPEAAGPLGMRVPLILPAGDRLTATSVPLRVLIRTAYGLQDFQIEGGPSWLTSDRFDITAKAETGQGGSLEAMLPMLKALLADRFGLRAHLETRELPTFDLVVARDDGRLGPKLAPSASDCSHAEEERQKVVDAFLKGGVTAIAPLLPGPGETRACSIMPNLSAAGAGGLGLRADGQPMAVITELLTALMGRPVEDRTGLTGLYDWELTFDVLALAEVAARQAGISLPAGVRLPESSGPSLLTALEEDLGLELDSTRGPVEVLVIDAVERPMPD